MALVTLNIYNSNFGSQLKEIVVKKVNDSIQRSGFLNPAQRKGIATRLTNILKQKLIHNDGKYNTSGQATLNLLNSARYIGETSTIVKSGSNYIMNQRYDLKMPKYGFIIGSAGFIFKPPIDSIANWLKAKIQRGVSNLYYQTTTSKNGVRGIKFKKLNAGSSNKEFKRAAFGIDAGKLMERTVVIPDWYKMTDKELEFEINRVAQALRRNIINAINK